MAEITYIEALREALKEEMARDKNVILLGEDIGVYGGAFKVTKGLLEMFGKERVIDTPMSEAGFTGIAIGSAIMGLRPVVEIMFMDFITLAMDQIINHAANFHYIWDNQVNVPIVIRTNIGMGRGYGATHSKNLEPLLLNIPGIKIVCPSNPADAKGLLKSSIRDNNPVIFIENRMLYGMKSEAPKENTIIPLGKAEVVKEGNDVTIISYSRMVQVVLESLNELDGISVELIDLRTIKPLDQETIRKSVKKTGRVLIVEECYKTGGIGAEIAAFISEECFDYLDAPIKRLASKDVPIACCPSLENEIYPKKADVIRTVRSMVM